MGRGRRVVAFACAWVIAACGDPARDDAELATSSDAASTSTTGPRPASDAPDPAPLTSDDAMTGDGSAAGSGDATGERPIGPPYPIVLAHGFFGFEEFAGVDFVTYFFDVRETLAEHGELLVFTPAVDPFNDSTTRGQQLLAHVEAIVHETGAAKVNLVGHSQGGLDARVVAHLRPDLVASVTTFATPHHGTPIADIALGLSENDNSANLVDALVQIVGAGLWDAVDGETSLADSMQQLSTPGMAEFNAQYPDATGVEYFSFTGRSSYHLGDPDCETDDPPAFVIEVQGERDAIEPLLSIPAAILSQSVLDPIANDGLVRAADAQWGTFLGCVPADHFDEIGQLFGDAPGLTNAWRHDQFYVDLVAWLRVTGH